MAADTRRERVYTALRARLMSGTLSPDERLSEERLAEQYGVSRTPVREALARLVSDGLVERRDQGLYPYRPRFDDLADLYELRTTLELRGIRRVLEDESVRHDPDVLGPELDHWYEIRSRPPEPDAGFVTLDERFHMTLLAASGNRALCDALASVNAKVRPVRMFDYLTPDRIAATVDEHIAVAELVLADKLDDAHHLLLAHIDTSRSVVVRRAEEARTFARMARAVRD
ncbi:GntR family transcriptional regulator [Rhodococcus gordoniae]|uniref:GntR family transcriptional regulator n=1 Tax=Rhodococcus gordoniae TaxID=223392 RepID=A0A379LYR2_9NOCA|nr:MULTISPECIES: GntR family transcriptional regulator [Rhodococcus]SUE15181.1 GntR family transcriptional regulator [Rhodococcus gordoniae]